MPSFTVGVPNLEAAGPCVKVSLAVSSAAEEALRKRSEAIPNPMQVLALIDTGAMATVIQTGVAQQLGLKPVGITWIQTPASSDVLCDKYLVRVAFMDSPTTVESTVVEAPLRGVSIQCLIGRDILAQGIFIYNGPVNQFTLSF